MICSFCQQDFISGVAHICRPEINKIASLQAQLAEKEKVIEKLLELIRGTKNVPFYKDITEKQIRKVMETK